MSRSRRQRIETLVKRAEHLERRIETSEMDGKRAGYDRAERAAIRWALPILEGHVEACAVLQSQLRDEKEQS